MARITSWMLINILHVFVYLMVHKVFRGVDCRWVILRLFLDLDGKIEELLLAALLWLALRWCSQASEWFESGELHLVVVGAGRRGRIGGHLVVVFGARSVAPRVVGRGTPVRDALLRPQRVLVELQAVVIVVVDR